MYIHMFIYRLDARQATPRSPKLREAVVEFGGRSIEFGGRSFTSVKPSSN